VGEGTKKAWKYQARADMMARRKGDLLRVSCQGGTSAPFFCSVHHHTKAWCTPLSHSPHAQWHADRSSLSNPVLDFDAQWRMKCAHPPFGGHCRVSLEQLITAAGAIPVSLETPPPSVSNLHLFRRFQWDFPLEVCNSSAFLVKILFVLWTT